MIAEKMLQKARTKENPRNPVEKLSGKNIKSPKNAKMSLFLPDSANIFGRNSFSDGGIKFSFFTFFTDAWEIPDTRSSWLSAEPSTRRSMRGSGTLRQHRIAVSNGQSPSTVYWYMSCERGFIDCSAQQQHNTITQQTQSHNKQQ
jgi:hypothetical protein